MHKNLKLKIITVSLWLQPFKDFLFVWRTTVSENKCKYLSAQLQCLRRCPLIFKQIAPCAPRFILHSLFRSTAWQKRLIAVRHKPFWAQRGAFLSAPFPCFLLFFLSILTIQLSVPGHDCSRHSYTPRVTLLSIQSCISQRCTGAGK